MEQAMRTQIVSVVAALVGAGCMNSAAPSEPTSNSNSSLIAGYNHTMAQSKCRLGSNVATSQDSGFTKWSGTYGVFAVDLVNASAACVGNAGAPPVQLSKSEAEHNQATLAYFTAAGIPTSQVGGVHATTNSYQASASFSSSLDRLVSGVPVVESHAMAQLDLSGEVVAEDVYWPSLDQSVADDASALSQIVSDPSQRAAYVAKLPPDLEAGSVVVHHASETVRTTFVAYATYDASTANTGGMSVRHFLKDGTEVRLPQENP
jgi:hypothetical protein